MMENEQVEFFVTQLKQNIFCYTINENENTASLIKCQSISKSTVFIPRCIKHNFREYKITKISEKFLFGLNDIKSIQFPSDSDIQFFEKGLFAFSSIEEISIPPKLLELQEGWCLDTQHISKVTVIPENKNYKSLNDIFILEKTNQKRKNYDILNFCVRVIDNVIIPNYIEIIKAYSFEQCKAQIINFMTDSQLRIIEEYAFFESSIKSISIPSSVTKIGKNAFYGCEQLEQVEFPKNSKLRIIEEYAFYGTQIESLIIPKEVEELQKDWCNNAQNLSKITVMAGNKRYKSYDNIFILEKSEPEKENYDVLIFCVYNIEDITIPSFVKIIKSGVFKEYNKLQFVDFESDSKLMIIENNAFFESSINRISIPPSVTHICKSAFQCCFDLLEVQFPENSKLSIIDEKAFSSTGIESISISPNVVKICKAAFFNCGYLKNVEFSKNGRLKVIESDAFNETSIETLSIPQSIEKIYKHSFSPFLQKIVVMPGNQNYSSYDDKFLLEKSSPEKEYFDVITLSVCDTKTLIIPSFIEIIGNEGFQCKNRNIIQIEFQSDSKLRRIEKNSFNGSLIEKITIPQHVTFIGDYAFSNCELLKTIVIQPNSELLHIGKDAFSFSSIESFWFPPHFSEINEMSFSNCHKLQIVEFNTKIKVHQINKSMFENLEHVIILINNDF